MEPSTDQNETNPSTAFRDIKPAHDEFYSALGAWINRTAPGRENFGRKDPTGGGFAGLSVAMQDAYRGMTLVYLCLLGLTSYAARIEADGRHDEVTEAHGLALDWYNDAMEVAQLRIPTKLHSCSDVVEHRS
jgi:hypothetical protein